MKDILKTKFTNKNGNVNVRYNHIIETLDSDELDYLNNLFPLYDNVYFKLKSLVLTDDYNRCVVCSDVIPWGNKTTCSKECYLKLHGDTCFDRYGVRTYINSEDFISKTKQTNVEKYGVDNALQAELVKSKRKQTNLKKYGVDNPSKHDDIKTKRKQTNLKKYGVDNPSKHDDVKTKINNTNVERYGYTRSIQNHDIKSKATNAIINNKVNYIREKLGIELTTDQASRLVLDVTGKYDYSDEYLKSIVDYVTTGTKPISNLINCEFDNYVTNNIKYNYFDLDKPKSCQSKYELELCSFIKSLGVTYKINDRSIIKPYELDIYIPDHKLAIEFNGSYWHSDRTVDKTYHQMKTKLCNDLGITLIHIYDYMYDKSKNIYHSIIRSKLGFNSKVYARKCEMRLVSNYEEKSFLNQYHLQGYTPSKYCFGLYYNNELLTLCSFGTSRFNKNYKFELIRNCTKSGITVVGGLSKLINHFKHTIDKNPILCYSDASISYNKSNNITKPNYVWVKSNIVYKRYSTMKHKLPKLLGDGFDPNLSESANMISNGFYRLYDSGNYVSLI